MNVIRKKQVRILLVAILVLVAALASVTSSLANSRNKIDDAAFQDEMRKLWEDHIVWTRLYIVSAVAGLPDQDATAQRLLKNQEDIGDAIRPFYGDDAGDQLTDLLKEHILVAAELIDAAKNNDTEAFEDAHERWYQNADEIAAFLSHANPRHWPEDEMRLMMKDHLDLTLKEASARLSGDFQADIAAYDEVHLQILHMADMLSDGILKQFPRMFN